MNYRRYIEYQTYVPAILLQTFLAGVMAGVFTWLIYLGLDRYVIGMIMCTDGNTACGSAQITSLVLALLVAHFLGLIMLVRAIVMRPLLVVLVSIATLWGFHAWLDGMTWWMGSLYLGLLFGIAYVFHAWVNRLLYFPVALVLTIVAVLGARVLLMSW